MRVGFDGEGVAVGVLEPRDPATPARAVMPLASWAIWS
jgi:hypothetical protein